MAEKLNKLKQMNKNQDIFLNEIKLVDLKSKSKIELSEILDRQERLLSNKKFINSLADKGAKIKMTKEKLLEELKIRENVDETASVLSRLTLGEMILPQHPTFTRKKNSTKIDKESPNDDDVNVEKSNAIDDDDKDEISQKSEAQANIFYGKILAKAFELKERKLSEDQKHLNKERFVLNKTIKTSKNDNETSVKIANKTKLTNYYEDTALKIFSNSSEIKTLTIDESLKLGEDTKLKEQQYKQTLLLNKLALLTNYRDDQNAKEEESDGDNDGINDVCLNEEF